MERTIWALRNPQDFLAQAERRAGLCLEKGSPTHWLRRWVSICRCRALGTPGGQEVGARPFCSHRAGCAWRTAGSAAPWSNHRPFLSPWFKSQPCPPQRPSTWVIHATSLSFSFPCLPAGTKNILTSKVFQEIKDSGSVECSSIVCALWGLKSHQ